ncbi:hypothetical protein BDQ17DRAFT_1344887 [Cyathus striatus]|nr:hypothetical protein BDQ17DRAFT_1344887 [Cyathus striatus]
MSSLESQLREVVVLGAGVIGLTAALKIQQCGRYRVTIIADVLPGDPKTIKYTSLWAGAHHVSVAGNDRRQQRIEFETFNTIPAEGCFKRLPQYEYYREERETEVVLQKMPNYKELSKDQLVPGAVSGLTYDTVNTDTPVFLPYLLSCSQAVQPDAVINCLGLGARFLGGIEDKNAYPVRGQAVMIRAPWVNRCLSLSGGEGGVWTYVIPRRSGDVIIGGTYEPNDWYPLPRHETRIDIIERILTIYPDIAPPEVRAERAPTVEDILPIIVDDACGFRPGRKDGVRLEVEWFERPKSNKKFLLCTTMGIHGGFGVLASYGSATVALELLEEALSKP